MAIRFSVSLAHAGCDHSGTVVWEERDRANAPLEAAPVVVSLPRGFVSLNAKDGSIEIVCAGCRQTVAAAARADAPRTEPAADQNIPETETEPGDATPEISATHGGISDLAVSADQAVAEPTTAVEATTPEPAVRAEAADMVVPPDDPPGDQAPLDQAPLVEAPTDQASNETKTEPVETTADDKVQADIEALFAEAKDVAPIRGDAIPSHLLDRLRHLADRMRQRRE